MKRLIAMALAGALILPVAACETTGGMTPEQRERTHARIQATLQAVRDFQEAGIIDPINVPEEILQGVVVACALARVYAAGDPYLEDVVDGYAPTCDTAREMLAEKQKPAPEPVPDPAPVPDVPAPTAMLAPLNIGTAG